MKTKDFETEIISYYNYIGYKYYECNEQGIGNYYLLENENESFLLKCCTFTNNTCKKKIQQLSELNSNCHKRFIINNKPLNEEVFNFAQEKNISILNVEDIIRYKHKILNTQFKESYSALGGSVTEGKFEREIRSVIQNNVDLLDLYSNYYIDYFSSNKKSNILKDCNFKKEPFFVKKENLNYLLDIPKDTKSIDIYELNISPFLFSDYISLPYTKTINLLKPLNKLKLGLSNNKCLFFVFFNNHDEIITFASDFIDKNEGFQIISDDIKGVSANDSSTFFLYESGRIKSTGLFQEIKSNLPQELNLRERMDSFDLKLGKDFFVNLVGHKNFHTEKIELREDGKLAVNSMGNNDFGQLGYKENKNTFICNPLDIVKLECGEYHTILLLKNGQYIFWGDNSHGQLGIDYLNKTFNPMLSEAIFRNRRVEDIAVGAFHNLFLTNYKEVVSFGSNSYGQIGNNDLKNHYTPYLIPLEVYNKQGQGDVVKIFATYNSSFSVHQNGEVTVWGRNDYGQLGLGHNRVTYKPTLNIYLSNKNIKKISGGIYHTFFLLDSGEVYVTGDGSLGQLGNLDHFLQPTLMSLSKKVKDVICGKFHTILVFEDNSIYSSGLNEYGQLGLGSEGIIREFTTVKNLKTVSQVVFSNKSLSKLLHILKEQTTNEEIPLNLTEKVRYDLNNSDKKEFLLVESVSRESEFSYIVKLQHEICGYNFSISSIDSNFIKNLECPRCTGEINRRTDYFKNYLLREFNDEYELICEYDYYKEDVKIKHSNCNRVFLIHSEEFWDKKRKKSSICPHCIKEKGTTQGEDRIRDWLENQDIRYKEQYRFDDCRNVNPLPFDFAVFINDKLIYLIEFDGLQHFTSVEYFGGEDAFKQRKENDEIKNNYCKENNIPLLRISHENFSEIENILSKKILPLT